MRIKDVKKVMVYDSGAKDAPHRSFYELMTKAKKLFEAYEIEFVRLCISEENHMKAIRLAADAVMREKPDILLIGATSAGEEIAPALGIRLGTGVAAHCSDIAVNGEGRIAFMVPAFGGKVIGEIFIPNKRPAIATVKPGVFEGNALSSGEYREIICGTENAGTDEGFGNLSTDGDSCKNGELYESSELRITGREEASGGGSDIDKAKLIFCGGYGIGSKENWDKIQLLAERSGGAAGCTRPVVDMDWGPDEYSMIGTSGRTVRPKVYVGFGISGAAHHICGIKDANIIININNDKNAEVFASSDYKATADAGKVIESLLEIL